MFSVLAEFGDDVLSLKTKFVNARREMHAVEEDDTIQKSKLHNHPRSMAFTGKKQVERSEWVVSSSKSNPLLILFNSKFYYCVINSVFKLNLVGEFARCVYHSIWQRSEKMGKFPQKKTTFY